MLFIDLFAGCGGLSLGLMQAGLEGVFAIEKSEDAFSTLKFNLLNNPRYTFQWPDWLPQEPVCIHTLIQKNESHLKKLRGKVDLVAGGPPCQGFSFVGNRDPNDPRNQLFEAYMQVVKYIMPRFLLFENVQGFASGFQTINQNGERLYTGSYADRLTVGLQNIGYKVFSKMLRSADVGIPQRRKRFLLFAIKNNDTVLQSFGLNSPFDLYYSILPEFRASKGLSEYDETTAFMAIGDLEAEGKEIISCTDSGAKGYMQIKYCPPEQMNPYLSLLRFGLNGDMPDSLRLVKHQPMTVDKFSKILSTCQLGRNLTLEDRRRLGIKKHAIMPLAADQLAATVTTLPDDMIHYKEPRVLTVRELARLQSFPDWFSFQGRYTTGNKLRVNQCPRYTQVGNAVPPLLAESLGFLLQKITNGSYHE